MVQKVETYYGLEFPIMKLQNQACNHSSLEMTSRAPISWWKPTPAPVSAEEALAGLQAEANSSHLPELPEQPHHHQMQPTPVSHYIHPSLGEFTWQVSLLDTNARRGPSGVPPSWAGSQGYCLALHYWKQEVGTEEMSICGKHSQVRALFCEQDLEVLVPLSSSLTTRASTEGPDSWTAPWNWERGMWGLGERERQMEEQRQKVLWISAPEAVCRMWARGGWRVAEYTPQSMLLLWWSDHFQLGSLEKTADAEGLSLNSPYWPNGTKCHKSPPQESYQPGKADCCHRMGD